MDRILIVIPTYNEKENIAALIDSLLVLNDSLDILVVDDGSPDGTSGVVKSHKAFGARLFIIDRQGKSGRGSACIAGFGFAFESGRYGRIVEMDADFSHDPKELPELLKKSLNNDVVIGSRYLKESRIVGWNLRRRIFSRLANIYARCVLGIPISDYTNGYRVYRTSELRRLKFESFRSSGYITLSEISFNLHRNGCSFAEVPITFVNRRRGASNLSFKEIKEAFLLLPKLRTSSARLP